MIHATRKSRKIGNSRWKKANIQGRSSIYERWRMRWNGTGAVKGVNHVWWGKERQFFWIESVHADTQLWRSMTTLCSQFIGDEKMKIIREILLTKHRNANNRRRSTEWHKNIYKNMIITFVQHNLLNFSWGDAQISLNFPQSHPSLIEHTLSAFSIVFSISAHISFVRSKIDCILWTLLRGQLPLRDSIGTDWEIAKMMLSAISQSFVLNYIEHLLKKKKKKKI